MRSRRMRAAVVALCLALSGQAQYWATDIGGMGHDRVIHLATDADGSIYVAGEFGGTMSVNGQGYIPVGGRDAFVARLNADGQVQWIRTGGGAGIDRAKRVALGPGNALVVAGEFMGEVDLFGQAMSSAGGSTDLFVALLDKNDGSLQWVRKGGGAVGTDQVSGLSVGATGQVCITGHFMGNASWEGQELQGTPDPVTGQVAADVFIAAYTPSGALQWLKQGRAKYADEGVDLQHVPGGGLVVVGQFSDTITFDLVHPNTITAASFILGLDADGQETWFKRMGGGTYNRVRDLLITPDGRRFLVGDVQGALYYFDQPLVTVPVIWDHAYYLLEIGPAGQLLQHAGSGSSAAMNAASLAMDGDGLAVYGTFRCRADGLSALYGEGVFMAVGEEDLFLARHASSDLALYKAQQIGGHAGKEAGAVTSMPDGGGLVFCGGYSTTIMFPSVAGFVAEHHAPGLLSSNMGMGHCGDPDYHRYAQNRAVDGMDGFVARGYVHAREPYDWSRRSGLDCDRPVRDIQLLGPGPYDTLRLCEFPAPFGPALNMGYSINPDPLDGISPLLDVLWMNGGTQITTGLSEEGEIWVHMDAINGCWAWKDTCYFFLKEQAPQPLVSDDIVVHEADPHPQSFIICEPNAYWAWAANADEAASVKWVFLPPSGPSITFHQDSVRLDTTGLYQVTLYSSEGCGMSAGFEVVDHHDVPIPQLFADIHLTFPTDTDGNDSLLICPFSNYPVALGADWMVDGVLAPLPTGLLLEWSILSSGFQELPLAGDTIWQIGWFEGWHVLQLVIRVRNGCTRQFQEFPWRDSVHIAFQSPIELDFDPPSVLCDGDTLLLAPECPACSLMAWHGIGTSVIVADSVFLSLPADISLLLVDTLGCTTWSSFVVSPPFVPVLSIDPPDGIICPGESATITSSVAGDAYTWYGPWGVVPEAGAELTTDQPGEYILQVMLDACPLTSDLALLSLYSTPFLHALPSATLCGPDGEVVLQIGATPGALVEWQPPLMGADLLQVITTPGTYACTVEACGITTPLSIVVDLATVTAAVIDPGPHTLCWGAELELVGVPTDGEGMWLPGTQLSDTLVVAAPGIYTYSATDLGGCTVSVPVEVLVPEFAVPVVAWGDTVCTGSMATVSAAGSGSFTWFFDPASGPPDQQGGEWQFLVPGPMVVYVVQEENGCAGAPVPVPVHARPLPPGSVVEGPGSICPGGTLQLSYVDAADMVVEWTYPAGTHTGAELVVEAVSPADAGAYTAVPFREGCAGPPVTRWVEVRTPLVVSLPDTMEFCAGGVLEVAPPADLDQAHWSNGGSGPQWFTEAAVIGLSGLDTAGCATSLWITVLPVDCEVELPNIFSPNGDGVNDTWLPRVGAMEAVARIHDRWGGLVHEGDVLRRPWTGDHQRTGGPCAEGVYFFTLELRTAQGAGRAYHGTIQLVR